MKILLALIIVSLLAACDVATNTVSPQRQAKNAAAISALKQDSILVCMRKKPVAMYVQYPDIQGGTLNGYIVSHLSTNFIGEIRIREFRSN